MPDKPSAIDEFKREMETDPPMFFGPALVIAEIIARLELLEDAVPMRKRPGDPPSSD